MGLLVTEILAALRTGKYADNAKQLGSLGRVFTDSAELNPNYFAVPGRVPERGLDKLSEKHGVRLIAPADDELGLSAYSGKDYYDPYAQTHSLYATDSGSNARDALWGAKEMDDPSEYALWANAIKRGQLTPDTQFFNIEASLAPGGTGFAKRAYPAAYEYILAQPDAANRTVTLSTPNLVGRSKNMVGALEKFGQRAGDRIRIDNEQLAPLGALSRESAYHALPQDSKVGLLNALVAPKTADRVNQVLNHISGMYGDVGNTGALRDEVKALGMRDGLWVPTTDVDKAFMPRLAEVLRKAGQLEGNRIGHQQVGIDSMRRAALTYDHLKHGLNAKDITNQPWLTDRLARRGGGSIPARKPGALQQTCGCEA